MPGRLEKSVLGTAFKPFDLEIKDANLIFGSVWAELEKDIGREHPRFPKEIIWLNGAPGAGKGTQTKFIMEFRDLTAEPILVSELLNSPEAIRLKNAGLMVGDREVTRLVFQQLLDPRYETGAVVDGYPRTMVQVQCLKLLYNKIMQLHHNQVDRPKAEMIRKTVFHIIVLFLDEKESVERQMLRGRKSMEHNDQVRTSGMGVIEEVRKTDLNEAAARERYRTFKEITYESLKSLREVFHYHYVNARGSIEEVRNRILEEMRYQSSLELNEAVFNRLNPLPVARNIAVHARQELIERFENYELHHSELFEKVVAIVRKEFIPIIKLHALSGKAYINSDNELFANPTALAILVDIFSERGYRAMVEIRPYDVPVRVDPETHRVETGRRKVYRFQVHFPGSDIRRGR